MDSLLDRMFPLPLLNVFYSQEAQLKLPWLLLALLVENPVVCVCTLTCLFLFLSYRFANTDVKEQGEVQVELWYKFIYTEK